MLVSDLPLSLHIVIFNKKEHLWKGWLFVCRKYITCHSCSWKLRYHQC